LQIAVRAMLLDPLHRLAHGDFHGAFALVQRQQRMQSREDLSDDSFSS
jgi:hypothetical protein